ERCQHRPGAPVTGRPGGTQRWVPAWTAPWAGTAPVPVGPVRPPGPGRLPAGDHLPLAVGGAVRLHGLERPGGGAQLRRSRQHPTGLHQPPVGRRPAERGAPRRLHRRRPEPGRSAAGPRGPPDDQVPVRAARRLLRPRGREPGHHRVPVEVPVQPGAHRGHQRGPGARRAGRAAAELARRPVGGALGDRRDGGVAVRRLLDGHLPGGHGGDPRRARGGGGARRRRPRRAVPQRDPPAHRPGHHDQRDALDHRRPEALRPGLRDHQRGTGLRHRGPVDPHLQGGLRVRPVRVQHRHRAGPRAPRGRRRPRPAEDPPVARGRGM
ncbi:MAG: ABC transporter, permease protein 1 (cluster 1, maltose/g3p/polyamine/iron), partial [uncultured Quadrisphaera sp.]